MVADKTRVEVFHEPERTVIDGKPKDAHVVSVHDSVHVAEALPLSHHLSSPFYYLLEKLLVVMLSQHLAVLVNFRIVILYNELKHLRHHLLFKAG